MSEDPVFRSGDVKFFISGLNGYWKVLEDKIIITLKNEFIQRKGRLSNSCIININSIEAVQFRPGDRLSHEYIRLISSDADQSTQAEHKLIIHRGFHSKTAGQIKDYIETYLKTKKQEG